MRGGKTTVDELSSSIGKVAPLAAQTNVSIEELLSGVSALTKGGISTTEAVTGMRAILAAVAKPTKEAADAARELGIEFNASALEAKGFQQFLKDIADSTGGSTEQLSKLFGGVEALIPVLSLTGEAGEDFNDILEQMGMKAGETEQAFTKMSETSEFQFNKLRANVTTASIEIGDAILETITPAVKALNENFDTVLDVVQILAITMTGRLAIAIAGSTAKMLTMSGAMVTATGSMKALSVAMSFFGGPIGLAIAGITTAVVLLGERTTEAEKIQEQYNEDVMTAKELYNNLEGATGSYREELEKEKAQLMQVQDQRIKNIEGLIAEAKAKAALLAQAGNDPLNTNQSLSVANTQGNRISEEYAKQIATVNELNDMLNILKSNQESVNRVLSTGSEVVREVKEETQGATKVTEDNAVATGKLTKEQKKLTDQLARKGKQLKDNTLGNQQATEQAKMLAEANRISAEEFERVSDMLEIKNQLMSQGFEVGTELYEINKELLEQEQMYRKEIQATNEARDEAAREAERLQEALNRPFENALDRLEGTVRDNIRGIFDGSINDAGDAADAIKDIFLDMAAEVATIDLLGPQGIDLEGGLGSLVKGVGDLFSGGSSSIDIVDTLGSVLDGGFDLDSIGSIFTDGFDMIGEVFTNGFDGIGEIFSGGGSLGGLASAGAGFAGSFASDLLGLSGEYSGIGGSAGAAIGTAVLPGIGTAIGSFLGSALGGAFGGSRPHPASNAGAFGFDENNNLVGTQLFSKHVGTEQAQELVDAVEGVARIFTEADIALDSINFLQTGIDDGRGFFALNGDFKEDRNDSSKVLNFDPENAEQAIGEFGIFLANTVQNAAGVIGENMIELINNIETEGRETAEILGDLDFILNFENIFKEAEEPLGPMESAIMAINSSYDMLLDTMERLGFTLEDVTRLEEKRNQELENFRQSAFENSITGFLDEVAPAVNTITSQFKEFQATRSDFTAAGIDTTFIDRTFVAKQEKAIAELQQQLFADRIDMINEEADAAANLVNEYSRIVETLEDAILNLRLSEISPLSPEERLNEARDAFQSTAARAAAGDVDAMRELEGLGTQFLNLSRDYFASTDEFVQDFNMVEKALETARDVAKDQLVEQEMLVKLAEQEIAVLENGFNMMTEALNNGNLLEQAQALNATDPIQGFTQEMLLEMFPDTANSIFVRNREQIQGAGLEDTFLGLLDAFTFGTNGGSGRQALFLDRNQGQNEALIQVARELGIPGFRTGGTMRSNSIAMVGEAGPEIFHSGGGGKVIPLQNGEQLENRIESLETEMRANNRILQAGFGRLIEATMEQTEVVEENGRNVGRV